MRHRLALAALAVLAVAALAGCADPVGSIQMESVDDATLADRASEATSGAGLYPGIDRQRTARQVIENGSARVTDTRPPLQSSLPYEYRGRYYNLSHEVVAREPGVETLLRVDYNATDPNGTRVALDAFPEVDRERLRPLLEDDPDFRRPGPEGELRVTYDDAQREVSTLLSHAGGSVVVSYRGREYAVEVHDPREVTLETYRYEATLVAASTGAYAERLTRRYAFELSGLDENETRVVEAALDDTYYPESRDDAGFDALVERFRRHEAVERDRDSGRWLVRYEGQRYWVEMRYGAFVEDESPAVTSPGVTPN